MKQASLKLQFIDTPKWKRITNRTDVPAIVIKASKSTDGRALDICSTCNKNYARYTCPRCESRYCSISCYRIHDILPPDLKNIGEPNGTKYLAGKCTESFYKSLVVMECKKDIKDYKNIRAMRNILTRAKIDGEEIENYHIPNFESKVKNQKLQSLSTDEWIELENYFGIPDNYDSESERTYLNSNIWDTLKIPIKIRKRFERDVMDGRMDFLIKEWHPFWLPNVRKLDRNGDTFIQSKTQDLETVNLEERILSITQFSKFLFLKSVDGFQRPKCFLQYNMVDILYGTAWVLRLYNGLNLQSTFEEHEIPLGINREDDTIAFMAAESLLSFSSVLSCDSRYSSAIDVLSECTSKSTVSISRGLNDCNIDSSTLVNDVIAISTERRLVLRVLICAEDILRIGQSVDVTKSSFVNEGTILSSKNFGHDSEELNLGTTSTLIHKRHKTKDFRFKMSLKRKLKIITKKVKYYQAWSRSYWNDIGNKLIEDIKEWQIYSSSFEENSNKYHGMDHLLPVNISNE